MDENLQVERLDSLIRGTWSSRSISAHNQITDIRALIGLLGGDFLSLDADAVEIETIVAIAMGVEDEFLTATDMKLIGQHLEQMKAELGEIRQVRT
ncbi:hypothetical protein JMK10_15535 [Rhodovulum sulfidophilum]|uniref:hypothetical protein n=1 Tax=Rhodovulum sulfidophilum TaxID=35806 RepID=UPI00192186A0|nr:hypothetical protein [Rhodovulum sulfidophilum]MBL3574511.1 hypothetical protein [Rhodovulum sulfidophilum]MCE8432085.1 hypothetical protein [Rhodovulum sulfidophilum]MCF4118186.1 hypothetical protein [Rhodovulum sulfidophilum]